MLREYKNIVVLFSLMVSCTISLDILLINCCMREHLLYDSPYVSAYTEYVRALVHMGVHEFISKRRQKTSP